MDMLPNQDEAFPTLNWPTNLDFNGNGEAMSPPEINIQLAPPSRMASFEFLRSEELDEALNRPDKSTPRLA
jgi:hypothetical protein